MCFAGEDAKVTGVSPDQLETQPVDLETLVTPSEPDRQFQAWQPWFWPKIRPKETKKEEDFTESDQAGGCGLDLNI